MKTVRIITIALVPAIFGLAYYLYAAIREPMQRQKRIERVEAQIIDKLKAIRDIQKGYYSLHQTYTPHFDTLKSFIREGQFYIVEKHERITKKESNPYADSVIVTYDTLGTVPVRDSLFSNVKYPKPDIEQLEKVPGTDTTFTMETDTIKKTSGTELPVFVVRDPAPINPDRQPGGENPRGALQVGSLQEATTGGNWK